MKSHISREVLLPFETPATAQEMLQLSDKTYYSDIIPPTQIQPEMLMDYLYQADLSLHQVLLLHAANLGCTESHSSSPSW